MVKQIINIPTQDVQGTVNVKRLSEKKSFSKFNGVSSVPKLAEIDIISLIIPSESIFRLKWGSASAMTDCCFKLYIDGNIIERLENSWTNRNVVFKTNMDVDHGKLIKITGQHKSDILHDIYATIIGELYYND